MTQGSQKVFLVAGSIVEQNGKFLLIQERVPEYHGKWNIPSGRVDEGENIIDAAKRETKEETGFNTEQACLVGVYESSIVIGGSVQCHIFEARIVGGELTVPDDILDVKWLSLDEIRDLEEQGLLMFPYILQAIEGCMAGR